MPPMWRQACPPIPSLPNPRAAILNFVKGVWGKWLIICIQNGTPGWLGYQKSPCL